MPEDARWAERNTAQDPLLNPGACKFMNSTSAQEVAKQVAEVMTAPGVSSMA